MGVSRKVLAFDAEGPFGGAQYNKISFPPVVYIPRDTGRWDEGYGRFLYVTRLASLAG